MRSSLSAAVSAALMFVIANCSGSSSDSTTAVSASTGSEARDTATAYVTSVVPGQLNIQLPASLTQSSSSTTLRLQSAGGTEHEGTFPEDGTTTDTAGTGTGAGTIDDVSGGSSSSQGFNQLVEAIQRTKNTVAELNMRMMEFDAGYSDVEAQCAGANPCTIADGQVCPVFTAGMAKAVEESMGEHAMTDTEFSGMDGLIGQQHCLPAMTITTLTDDPAGYTFRVAMTHDTDNSSTVEWNEAKTLIRVTEKFSENLEEAFAGEEFGEDEHASGDLQNSSSAATFTGTFTYTFDSVKQLFKWSSTHSSSTGGQSQSHTENLTLQGDATKEDVTGIKVTGQLSGEGAFGKWETSFVGGTTDTGGYMDTTYGWTEVSVSEITLSTETVLNTEYVIFPSTITDSEADHMFSIGSVWGDGTATPTGAYFHGLIPSDPTVLKIYTVTYDESNDWLPSFAASSMTISSLSTTRTTNQSYYSEMWDADGDITAWCHKDTEAGECIGSGTFEGEHYEDYGVAEVEFDEIAVTLSGVTASGLQGENDPHPPMLYFASGDLTAVEAHSPDFWNLIIGNAWYEDWENSASTENVNQYAFSFWGTADQVSTATVYKESFDPNTGEVSFVTVSATLQTVE